MKIARLNGLTVGEIADHKTLFPNVSFPSTGPDATWLSANSCAEVVKFLAFDSTTQKSEGVDPYLEDGKIYTRRVVDLTLDDIASRTAALEASNRKHRDRLLAETDYMALTDVPMSSEVTAYRQALRDITTHANWPNLAYPDMDGSGGDWPTKP
jgi:hypothetical protein